MMNTIEALPGTGPGLSTAEQKGLICDILTDFVADPDVEVLFAYLRHCGLPLQALRSVRDIVPAFLALYRIRPGHYDVDRAFEHLRWWPPIAARMAYLEAQAKAEAEAGAGACVESEKLPHDL